MLKKILLSLLAIVVIFIAALAILPIIYKDKLVAIAKQEIDSNINAQVNFSDMGLSAFKDFPNISLYIRKLAVVNDAPFKNDTLAKIGEVLISVNIMDLIKGHQVSIKAIKLDHPVFHVIVLKDGTANYNIMIPDSAKPDKVKDHNNYTVRLKNFTIKEGNLIYDDKEERLFVQVDGLNNKLSGNFGENNFELNDNGSTGPVTLRSGGITYLNKVKLAMKLAMDIDRQHEKYTFKENNVQLNDLKLGFKGFVAMGKKNEVDMDLAFNAKEPDFRHFISLVPAVYSDEFKNVKCTGSVQLDGFVKGKYAGAMYPAFGATLKVDNATFQYPGLPAAVTGINIDVKAKNRGGSLDNTIVDVDKFNMSLAGDPFDLKLHLTNPVLDPEVEASANGKINLGGVKNYYPLNGAELSGILLVDVAAKGRVKAVEEEKFDDFYASGTVEVSDLKYSDKDLPKAVNIKNIKLTFAPEKVTLDNFTAHIGKSDFEATGQLDNLLNYVFNKAVLTGSLDVRSNQIDLNELLADDDTVAVEKNKAAETGKNKTRGTEKVTTKPAANKQPVASASQVPANIDFTVNLEAKKIYYTNMEMDSVSGKLYIRNETVTLNGLQGFAFDGNVIIDGDYSTFKTQVPKVDMKMKMDQVTIEKAIAKLETTMAIMPIVKSMKGVLSLVLTVKADLQKDMSPNLNTMIADGRVDIHHMEFSGNKTVNSLAERIKMAELRLIRAKDFFTVIKVAEGKMFVKPFNITMDKINLSVYGSHSLTDTADMNYNVLIDTPAEKVGGNDNEGKGAKRLKYKIAMNGKNSDQGINVKQTGTDGVMVNDEQQKINDEQQKLIAQADSSQKHSENKATADLDRRTQIAQRHAERKAAKLKEHAEQKAKDTGN